MSTYTRTIHTTMNAADTATAAETIASNLRAQGLTADVGKVYDDVTVRYYGMPAVDITVTEADVPVAEAPALEPPTDDTPEPMPVAEFGGSGALATTVPPLGKRFTESSTVETVDEPATVEPETAPETAESEEAAAPAAATPTEENLGIPKETRKAPSASRKHVRKTGRRAR